jgi:hypothetical protein
MFAFCLLTLQVIAQQDSSYYKAVTKILARTEPSEELVKWNLKNANDFSRIAEAEGGKWLPYYYAAFYMVSASYEEKNIENIDPLCDKAVSFLEKATKLSPKNSENYCIKAMIALARIQVDFMGRGLTSLSEAQASLSAAVECDVNNPRAYYLLGQQAYKTPEAFGGSKKQALKLFERAADLFEKQHNRKDTIEVNWGEESNSAMKRNCKNALQPKTAE